MNKPLKIILLSITILSTVAFAILIFYLYDVPISLSFYDEVIKDSYLNFTSITKNQKPANKVHKGFDGYLFYHKEISAFLLRWRFNTENALMLSNLADSLKMQGIQVIYIPVPNKIDIYPENYLSTEAPELIKRKRVQFFKLFKQTQTTALDLYPYFVQEKIKGLLYYKTDTHWNSTAKETAATIISEVLKSINFQKQLDSSVRKVDTTILRSTDLNRLIGNTSMTSYRIRCVIDSNSKPLQKNEGTEVVIIGDSFGNSEHQYGADLGSFLAYELNTPVNFFCTSTTHGADFINFVKRTIPKLMAKPKVIVIVFSSRKLTWKLK